MSTVFARLQRHWILLAAAVISAACSSCLNADADKPGRPCSEERWPTEHSRGLIYNCDSFIQHVKIVSAQGGIDSEGLRTYDQYHGLWKFYNTNGFVEKIALFDEGICLWRIDYNSGDTIRVLHFLNNSILSVMEYEHGIFTSIQLYPTLCDNVDSLHFRSVAILPDLREWGVKWAGVIASSLDCQPREQMPVKLHAVQGNVYAMKLSSSNSDTCTAPTMTGMVFWRKGGQEGASSFEFRPTSTTGTSMTPTTASPR